MEEVKILLGGLFTTLFSPRSAATALPTAKADLWGRDVYVFLIFAAFFFVANWGLRLLVLQPFARACLPIKPSVVPKFAQSAVEACLYGGFAIAGYFVVAGQEWAWPSSKWWIGFAEGGHEIMRSDLRCYYIAYAARYFQAGISVLLEPRRKDFIEMNIHHWVTLILCVISYIYGWNRIGCIVMFLMDPADVPLHCAKMCKYIADETKHSVVVFVSDRLFETFAVFFFVTRLCLYPYVCWSAHIEANRYFPRTWAEWTCIALLEFLLVMQVFWFRLIIYVAIKMAKGENAKDERSDTEDDGDDPEPKKKK